MNQPRVLSGDQRHAVEKVVLDHGFHLLKNLLDSFSTCAILHYDKRNQDS
jgi:hypothetical protein